MGRGTDTLLMSGFRRGGTVASVVAAMLLWQGASSCAWGESAGSPPRKPDSCNRAAFRVIVDVGHSVEAPGARSARGAAEYEFNLRLATLSSKA